MRTKWLRVKFLIAIVGIVSVVTYPVLAAPNVCTRIVSALPDVLHGSVVFLNKKGRWQVLNKQTKRDQIRSTQFWYISKKARNRSGILVIKSGRPAGPDDVSNPRVKILRKKTKGDRRRNFSDKCYANRADNPLSRSFGVDEDKAVRQDIYARFHRFGDNSGEDVRQLTDFHVSYESDREDFAHLAPKERCIRTDDHGRSAGKLFLLGGPTNRNRFSFERDVVEGGSNIVVAAFWRLIPTAVASEKHLKELKVQMQPFALSNSGSICVPFRVSGLRKDSFLRVNDLDEVNALSIRAPEFRWDGGR